MNIYEDYSFLVIESIPGLIIDHDGVQPQSKVRKSNINVYVYIFFLILEIACIYKLNSLEEIQNKARSRRGDRNLSSRWQIFFYVNFYISSRNFRLIYLAAAFETSFFRNFSRIIRCMFVFHKFFL